MTAISTALRKRWRAAIVPQLAVGNVRTVSEYIAVTENVLPKYVRIVSGDRITSVLDFSDLKYVQSPSALDSFDVNDLLIARKSTSPVLFDAIAINDIDDVELNIGRATDNLNAWYDFNYSVLTGPKWSVQAVTGPASNSALQCVDNIDGSETCLSESFKIRAGHKYKVSTYFRQLSGDRINFLEVAFFDSAGLRINSASSPVSDAVNWPYGVNYGHYYGLGGEVGPSSWTRYSIEFGGDAAATIPSNAASFRIGGYFTSTGTTETTIQIQDLFVTDLTEPLALRQAERRISDSFTATDNYQKNIIRVPFVINSKVLPNNKVDVSDGIDFYAFGIQTKVLADSISVVDFDQRKPIRDITRFDGFQFYDSKNIVITRYSSTTTVIFDRVSFNGIDVTDTVNAIKSGIFNKTLSDSLAIADSDLMLVNKAFSDSLDTNDFSIEHRLREWTLDEYAEITDDVIVTRTSITREVTIADSITTFDQALASYTEFIQVSADIIIDIEIP